MTPPRAPQLEETPETPPSSRAEGLLFLHGLESNPGPLGWPWEAQSSPRVARESWGWRSSHCRA